MDLRLRDECRDLLTKLKVSQKSIRDKLDFTTTLQQDCHPVQNESNSHPKFGEDIRGNVIVSPEADSNLKPTYARNKLLSLSKHSNDNVGGVANLKDKENHHGYKSLSQSNDIWLNSNESSKDPQSINCRVDGVPPSFTSKMASSPSRFRKRQLINKHTSVPSKLNSEELQELDDERLLNFDYSNISLDRNGSIKTLSNVGSNGLERKKSKDESQTVPESKPISHPIDFHQQLEDQGNNRRHGNWLKETTIQPKTILNSSNYYSLCKRKNNSRVRFDSSSNEEMPVVDQRLLGYDWIAALLDNEKNAIDQSESFFDEICDFRKAFKDECDNRFYKESPYTLVESEPEPVVEALTEPKVRPFVVNERLFTEPLNSNLLEDQYDEKSLSSKEPTKADPRFVRVSIPRSTLQTPYRVRPHRRGSFDGSDSCALMDHCLLGWENTVPSLMPPAKSLSLAADARTQIKSQTTTLAEAERLATQSSQVQWHLQRPSSQSQVLPRWRKHYMDTTLNLSLPSNGQANISSSSLTNSLSASGGRGDIKRRTDKILQATYSTMYEMERLRKERDSDKDHQF